MPQQVIEIPIEYKRLFNGDWREAAVHGGRFSLKSHTVARVLLLRARAEKKRIACFREFQNSITESSHQLLADLIQLYHLNEFKVTDNAIINQLNGSDFLFKGLRHNEQSIKSIEGIDLAWVEEAQTISNSSLEVLTPTVRKPGSQIIYTYNRLLEADPVHQRLVVEGRPNTLVINANYDIALKYGWMPDVIRAEMEDDRERRPALYKHKWLGEPNTSEGRIYTDWAVIDEIPHEAQLVRRGLDFGYSNDPTTIVDVYSYNGGYILAERCYRVGMHNRDIAALLESLEQPHTLVMADSAEPKSIDEIRLRGINITGVDKKGVQGKSYLRYSIEQMQEKRISVTRLSQNLLREYGSFMWMEDKEGRKLNEPTPGNDHALDAARYAFDGLRPAIDVDVVIPDWIQERLNR